VALAEAYLRTKWHLNPSSRLATTDMGGGRKLGEGLCPLEGGGDGFPSNTMSPGWRPTSVPSGILIDQVVWPQQTWAENLEEAVLSFGEEEQELGPHLARCGQGRGLPPCQCHLNPSSRLTTIDVGRKLGLPILAKELGPYPPQCGLGRGLSPYQVHLDPFSRLATIDMGHKLAALVIWRKGSWVPI